MNLLLNTNLNGIPIQDINLGMIARLKEQAGSHSGVVATVLDAVAATIHVEEEDMEIYTSGATNIFKYPELADKEKATELISAFEEKHELADLVKEQMSDGENTGIQVYIGDAVSYTHLIAIHIREKIHKIKRSGFLSYQILKVEKLHLKLFNPVNSF